MGIFGFMKKKKPAEQAPADQLDIPPPPPDASLQEPSAGNQPGPEPSQPAPDDMDMTNFPEPPKDQDLDISLPPLGDKDASFAPPDQSFDMHMQPPEMDQPPMPDDQSPDALPQPVEVPPPVEQEPIEPAPEPKGEGFPSEEELKETLQPPTQPAQMDYPEEDQSPPTMPVEDDSLDFSKPLFVDFKHVIDAHNTMDEIRVHFKLGEESLHAFSTTASRLNQEYDKFHKAAESALKKMTRLNKEIALR